MRQILACTEGTDGGVCPKCHHYHPIGTPRPGPARQRLGRLYADYTPDQLLHCIRENLARYDAREDVESTEMGTEILGGLAHLMDELDYKLTRTDVRLPADWSETR